MAYNTNQFQNPAKQNKPSSVNTSSLNLFNEDMNLRLSFMDTCLCINFIPAQLRDDGTRSFPKEAGLWCVIHEEYAFLMLRWLEEYFIPIALEHHNKYLENPSIELDPVLIGIPINKDSTNMVAFRYDKPDKDGAMVPDIIYYNQIGVDRKPNKIARYTFGTRKIFTEYSPESGDYSLSLDQVQFWVFKKVLENFCNAVTMAQSHAEKLSSNFVNKEMRNYIRQIAVKNGIPVQQYTSGGTFEKPNNTNFPDAGEQNQPVTLNSMLALPGGEEMPF